MVPNGVQEALQEEIRLCKSLTDKPFGVNLTLLPALAPPNYDECVHTPTHPHTPIGHFLPFCCADPMLTLCYPCRTYPDP